MMTTHSRKVPSPPPFPSSRSTYRRSPRNSLPRRNEVSGIASAVPVHSVEDAAKAPRGGPYTQSIRAVAATLLVVTATLVWSSKSGATPSPSPSTVQNPIKSEPTKPSEATTAEAAYNQASGFAAWSGTMPTQTYTPNPVLACAGMAPPPKPNQAMWKQLRDAYRATISEWESTDSVDGDSVDDDSVDDDSVDDDSVDDDSVDESDPFDFPSNDDESNPGIQIPYEVRESPGKGYGIFAATDVKRGTVVFDKMTKYTAYFWEEDDYVDFLSHMPRELACRVLHWTCVYPSNGVLMSELADVSLTNGADRDGANANVGCIGTAKECVARFEGADDREYALRDIAAGEEIIEDYSLQLNRDHFDWWEKYWYGGMQLGDWGAKLNAVYGAEEKEQSGLAALRRQKTGTLARYI